MAYTFYRETNKGFGGVNIEGDTCDSIEGSFDGLTDQYPFKKGLGNAF